MPRILIVEDDEALQADLTLQLRREGHTTTAVPSAEDALRWLEREGAPDLLLVDVRLAGPASGVDLVRTLAAERRLPPTLVVSGEATISETVEALQLGVRDFLEKPFGRQRLRQSVANVLEHAHLARQVSDLGAALDEERRIVGSSEAIAALRRDVERLAAVDARVLVVGESGTGKELVAEQIHRASRRSEGPFVRVNCAALAPTLVEAELFGHVKGAFTDAHTSRAGLFEAADGGTILLDEIGDMDLDLQSRLLRVLEDWRVRRLGETRERAIDVRVLAATHRDLEAAVAAGRFRLDLYYRLAHVPLRVPPLRERGDDVVLLAEIFLSRAARRYGVRVPEIDAATLRDLRGHHWPGNVRELQHVCERFVILGPQSVAGLLASGRGGVREERRHGEGSVLRLGELPTDLSLRDLRTRCEGEYVELVLRRHDWQFAAAARTLGIRRTYLHEKVKALGIRRPARGDAAD